MLYDRGIIGLFITIILIIRTINDISICVKKNNNRTIDTINWFFLFIIILSINEPMFSYFQFSEMMFIFCIILIEKMRYMSIKQLKSKSIIMRY